jgi:hypothetical protein
MLARSRVKFTNESDSDEATKEVISHTERLEALKRALLYVEQHSKATPTHVIFMKRWRDIAASSHCSTLYQKKITYFVKKRTIFKCVSYSVNFRLNKYKFFSITFFFNLFGLTEISD